MKQECIKTFLCLFALAYLTGGITVFIFKSDIVQSIDNLYEVEAKNGY